MTDKELGDQTVSINPHETDTFTAAITTALTMDESERRDRMETLRHHVQANELSAWMTTVFETSRDIQ